MARLIERVIVRRLERVYNPVVNLTDNKGAIPWRVLPPLPERFVLTEN